jgi:hypothetical protein
MKLRVRNIISYKELTIHDGGTTIVTGPLNEEERRALAAELIDAAQDLLYGLEEPDTRSQYPAACRVSDFHCTYPECGCGR